MATDNAEIKKNLVAAQKMILNPTKDSTNPFLKNKYASLGSVIEVCKSALLERGIIVSQECSMNGNNVLDVHTHLIHESGEELVFNTSVVLKELTPQGTMGGFTYGRRYGLLAIFNLAAEDDDGNEASGRGDVLDSQAVKLDASAAKAILAAKAPKVLGGK